MEIRDVESEWLAHVKDDFPRELFTWREIVGSDVLFLSRIKEQFGRRNIFCSVYPTDIREKETVDCLFYDMDCSDLSDAHREMRTIVRHSMNRLDYEPRIYFSGMKGFHFYFDFEPVKLEANFRSLSAKFLDFLKVPTNPIDWHTVGDIQRISRVPFTTHIKSGRMCVPIDPAWSLRRILSESKKCRIEKTVSPTNNKNVRDIFEKFNDPNLYPTPTIKINTHDISEFNSIRPCLTAKMESTHPSHSTRLAFVVEAVYNGWSESEIIGAFSHVEDFGVGDVTTKQVRYTLQKVSDGLKPWKCLTLKERKVCSNECSYIGNSYSKPYKENGYNKP